MHDCSPCRKGSKRPCDPCQEPVLSLTRFWINDAKSGSPESSIPARLPIVFLPTDPAASISCRTGNKHTCRKLQGRRNFSCQLRSWDRKERAVIDRLSARSASQRQSARNITDQVHRSVSSLHLRVQSSFLAGGGSLRARALFRPSLHSKGRQMPAQALRWPFPPQHRL